MICRSTSQTLKTCVRLSWPRTKSAIRWTRSLIAFSGSRVFVDDMGGIPFRELVEP